MATRDLGPALVQLQSNSTHIQWAPFASSSWINLVALSQLTGPQGLQGFSVTATPTATGVRGSIWHGNWTTMPDGGSALASISILDSTGAQIFSASALTMAYDSTTNSTYYESAVSSTIMAQWAEIRFQFYSNTVLMAEAVTVKGDRGTDGLDAKRWLVAVDEPLNQVTLDIDFDYGRTDLTADLTVYDSQAQVLVTVTGISLTWDGSKSEAVFSVTGISGWASMVWSLHDPSSVLIDNGGVYRGLAGESGPPGPSGTAVTLQSGRWYDPDATYTYTIPSDAQPLPDIADVPAGNAYAVYDPISVLVYNLYYAGSPAPAAAWTVIPDWGGIPGPSGTDAVVWNFSVLGANSATLQAHYRDYSAGTLSIVIHSGTGTVITSLTGVPWIYSGGVSQAALSFTQPITDWADASWQVYSAVGTLIESGVCYRGQRGEVGPEGPAPHEVSIVVSSDQVAVTLRGQDYSADSGALRLYAGATPTEYTGAVISYDGVDSTFSFSFGAPLPNPLGSSITSYEAIVYSGGIPIAPANIKVDRYFVRGVVGAQGATGSRGSVWQTTADVVGTAGGTVSITTVGALPDPVINDYVISLASSSAGEYGVITAVAVVPGGFSCTYTYIGHIAATQVQADWEESSTSSPAYIQNKPDIPSMQVNADWDETDSTSKAYIENKPTIPAAQVNSDWNAAAGIAEILNKPTIPAAQVNSDWDATSGVAEILNKPTIPAAQVNSDWNASSGVAEILNKPSIPDISNKLDKVITDSSGNNVTAANTGTAFTVVQSAASDPTHVQSSLTLKTGETALIEKTDAYGSESALYTMPGYALMERKLYQTDALNYASQQLYLQDGLTRPQYDYKQNSELIHYGVDTDDSYIAPTYIPGAAGKNTDALMANWLYLHGYVSGATAFPLAAGSQWLDGSVVPLTGIFSLTGTALQGVLDGGSGVASLAGLTYATGGNRDELHDVAFVDDFLSPVSATNKGVTEAETTKTWFFADTSNTLVPEISGTTSIPLSTVTIMGVPAVASQLVVGKTLISGPDGSTGLLTQIIGNSTCVVMTKNTSYSGTAPANLGNVPTKADLPATLSGATTQFGRTPNVGDFLQVIADESHGGATYQYYVLTTSVSDDTITYGNEFPVNTSTYQAQTSTGDAGKLLVGGATAGTFGTSRSIATDLSVAAATDIPAAGAVNTALDYVAVKATDFVTALTSSNLGITEHDLDTDLNPYTPISS